MILRTPRSKPTYTTFPYTTLFRSASPPTSRCGRCGLVGGSNPNSTAQGWRGKIDQTERKPALALVANHSYLGRVRRCWSRAMPTDLIKTFPYLSIHLTIGFSVAYVMTGSVALAGGIGIIRS